MAAIRKLNAMPHIRPPVSTGRENYSSILFDFSSRWWGYKSTPGGENGIETDLHPWRRTCAPAAERHGVFGMVRLVEHFRQRQSQRANTYRGGRYYINTRPGGYLGEAENAAVHLCHVGDSRILEVIRETQYARHVAGQQRRLLINVHPGNPTSLAATHVNARDPTDDWPTIEQKINPIQADLPVCETPMLTKTLAYQHISHHLRRRLPLFPEPEERTAATNIQAGTPSPNCKPNSFPPPRIHRRQQYPIGNKCTEEAARKWRACAPTEAVLYLKSWLFVPVCGGQRGRSIDTIFQRNYRD